MTNKIAIRVKPRKRWADVSNMTRHGKREDPSRHVTRDYAHQNIHFSFVEIEHQTDERGTVTQHGDFGIFEHDGLNGLDIGEQFQNLAEESGASWRKNAGIMHKLGRVIASASYDRSTPASWPAPASILTRPRPT